MNFTRPVAFTAGGPGKQSTVELTWALILATTKRILEQNRLLLDGGWRNENSLVPLLQGQRLGLIGLGHIGSKVAQVATALGATLLSEFLGRSLSLIMILVMRCMVMQEWKSSFGLRT